MHICPVSSISTMRHSASLVQRGEQTGAVLAVALILLLALTILGVAALNGNKLQTRLSYNAAESTVAFQAAESALAAGEIWLASQTIPPVPGCIASTTAPTAADCPTNTSVWDKSSPEVTTNTATLDFFTSPEWWAINGRKYGFNYVDDVTPTLQIGQAIPNITDENTPKYVVQYLGTSEECSLDPTATACTLFYEVTAKGTGALASGENTTVVQSVYVMKF